MESIRQEIAVPFRYNVHFTRDLFSLDNSLLAAVTAGAESGGTSKGLCVLDDGVAAATPNLSAKIEEYCKRRGALELVCPPLIVPGGERAKNTDEFVHLVQKAICDYGICRQSYVLAIGGGALLDMAGYAAATAHRGVRIIRVPTTVLSQNDSGVGVKNGINAYGIKNFLGAFAPPYAVLNDLRFLETLGLRDWRSGIAEAVKVSLIKDAEFFASIEQSAPALVSRDMDAMEELVYRCAHLHLQHIQGCGDPFESGSSRPLDFGHWSAHKLEQLSGFRLRHGEAVAIGIALDSTYSWLSGLLTEAEWFRIIDLLLALGFTLDVPELARPLSPNDPHSLLHGLAEFQQHLGGPLTLTLLEAIGRGIEVHEMDYDLVAASVRNLRQRLLLSRAPALPERRAYALDLSSTNTQAGGRVFSRKPS